MQFIQTEVIKDYLAIMNDVHPRHSGVLFEQIHQASLSATFYLRAMGLALPRAEGVPTQAEVYNHLCRLVNGALDEYFHAQSKAPAKQRPNEIWGENNDSLFAVEVTGLSDTEGDGYTVSIDFNLLYR